jgi:hypothetical protein
MFAFPASPNPLRQSGASMAPPATRLLHTHLAPPFSAFIFVIVACDHT